MNKKIVIFVCVLHLTLFFGAAQTIEEIVAIVNNDIITRSDYEQQLRAIYDGLRAQLQGEEFQKQYDFAKENLLDSMIIGMLLLQEAKAKGIDAKEQVNLGLENLKKENNITSDDQFRRELAKQGMSFEDFKKQWEEMLMKQNVLYVEVDSKIVLDDTKILSYFNTHPEEFTSPEEYKLRAILILASEKTSDEIEAKKQDILKRLQNGEDMAELAAQYSEGPEKESQGDLGSFKKGDLSKDLEDAVINLKPGEITSWIKIPSGYYLLKLEEKKESELKAFEEVKEQIQNKLFSEQKQIKEQEYYTKLREGNYVKIIK